MKNRIIVFVILAFLLVPGASFAMIYIPDTTFTVVANSEGEDALFNFKIQYYNTECEYDEYDNETCTSGWYDNQSFSLQTESLTAQNTFTNFPFWGTDRIIENVPEGFKVSSIHCASANPDDVFFYQENGVVFGFPEHANIVCIFNNEKISNKTPVLIVPGLTGTELKDGGNLLWLNLGKMFGDIGDDFLDVIGFNTNLTPIKSNLETGDLIKSPAVNEHYYDLILTEFQNQGYVDGETLFTFPYDWRYGVSGKYADGKTNSDLLEEKIQAILTQTGADRVDVVAHSMGGLIVKKYVIENQSDSHINKAVFVGVPNTGSPEAVKILLQGDNFGIPWLADAEIKKIAVNMPASYDLLPSQKYYNDSGSFVTVINADQATEKKLNYNETKSFLTDDHGLNALGLTNAESLHTTSFDNYDLRTAGIDLYAVDGCRAPTMSNITQITRGTLLGDDVDYRNIKWGLGDGTVPLQSATNLPIDESKKYYSLAGDHGKMLSQNGSRQQIVNLIANTSLDTGKDFMHGDRVTGDIITQDVGKCQLNGKAIVVLSPVDITVTDQNGNKLGLAQDQSVMNQIPGADFEIWGDPASPAGRHKFIFLPTDNGENYSINMQGTGSGTYTIKVQDIAGSEILKTEVFSNLPVTQNLTGQINLLPNQTTLAVKQNENSNTETILPQATITQEQSDDLISPVSKTTLSGTAGQPGFYKSDVAVKILATDDLSGVLAVQYNLDNKGFQKTLGNSETFSVSAEGKHTITFFGTDNAGNNEQEKTIEFTIDKTAPEAKIEFDSNAKDLKFSGVDALQVSVVDKDDTITLTDQAGNITEIKLLNKNRKVLRSVLGVKSIKYNGAQAKVNGLATFSWAVDRKGKLIVLSQSVLLKNGYTILAIYDGKNTKMTGRDSKGLILKKFSGLKIIKVLTSKGNLSWEY